MKRLILAVFCLGCTLGLVASAEPDEQESVQPCPPCPCLKPSIDIDKKSGLTNENVTASFKFTMKDLGTKKLHPLNALVFVSINGVDKTSKAMLDQQGGGTKGTIDVTDTGGYNLPAGDYTVKLKVKLDNDITVDGEAKVTFKKSCCPCP